MMDYVIKIEYSWFLKCKMTMRVEGNILIENTPMGTREYDKCDLNEMGCFNFKYVVDRK